MIRVPTEEALREGNKAWQRTVGIDPDRAPPDPINIEAVRALGSSMTLSWDGVIYDVPPVPFLDAVTLDTLNRRLKSMPEEAETEDEIIAWKILLNDLAVLFRSLVQPRGSLARWRWRHSRTNPFISLSPQEVGQLISFFYMCRMTSRFGNVDSSESSTKNQLRRI